jgi:hypothetical protein
MRSSSQRTGADSSMTEADPLFLPRASGAHSPGSVATESRRRGFGARRLVECGLAFVLAAAASLKLYAFWRSGQWVLAGLSYNPVTVALLLEAEYALAIWLCAGGYDRARFAVSWCCFAALACVAGYEAWRGLATCGCFGTLNVPPWATAGFDVLALGALWATRPARGVRGNPAMSRRRAAVAAILMVLVSSVLWGAMAYGRAAAPLPSGGLTVLEPETWRGREFPLLRDIPHSDALRQGRWLVVIYHDDCEACRRAVPKYQALAGVHGASRMAFVAMPSGGKDPHPLVSPSPAYAALALRRDYQWFATTPILVALDDGVVAFAAEGDSAVEPPGDIPWR